MAQGAAIIPSPQAPRRYPRDTFQQGLYDQVLKNARLAAQAEAARHTHRDSPYAAVDNAHPLVLRLDGESGRVLPEGESARVTLEIRYQLRPDENRLALDPETVRGLEDTLRQLPEGSEVVKTVIEALLDLPKVPIVLPRGGHLALEGGFAPDGSMVLPPADPAILEFNRGALHTKDAHNVQMTVMLGGDSAAFKHWYSVGTLSLEAEGRVVGSSLGRPDFQSPRGTQYRKGMAVGGDEVPVILYGDTVVWMGPLGDLNPKQQSAMLALFDVSAAHREALLRGDPYSVDGILGQGLGRMAMDLGSIVFSRSSLLGRKARQEPTEIFLKVIRDEQGLLRLEAEGEATPALAGSARLSTSGTRLGGVQLRYQFADDGSALRRGPMLLPALQRLEFQVQPGTEQSAEIAELLNFLNKSWTTQEAAIELFQP